jgi:hypothetical protein
VDLTLQEYLEVQDRLENGTGHGLLPVLIASVMMAVIALLADRGLGRVHKKRYTTP